MLQQMITVIRGMKDTEKLNRLLAAIVARFAMLEGRDATADRLRGMIKTLGRGD
jgi:hypothetical protein